jgi:hypothetical protein
VWFTTSSVAVRWAVLVLPLRPHGGDEAPGLRLEDRKVPIAGSCALEARGDPTAGRGGQRGGGLRGAVEQPRRAVAVLVARGGDGGVEEVARLCRWGNGGEGEDGDEKSARASAHWVVNVRCVTIWR